MDRKAVREMQITTGKEPEEFDTSEDCMDEAAASLGKRGSKGRAEKLTAKERSEIGRRPSSERKEVDKSCIISETVADDYSHKEKTSVPDRRVEAGHFLNDQISIAQRALIPATLKQAYKAADDLAKESPILDVISARDQHGRVRTWAVDLAFEKLITTGKWPFDCGWSSYARPTGRYLRIRTEAATISISLVDNPKKPPRHACFRQNNAMANPPYLFPEMEEELRLEGVPGFVLTHGHKDLDFAYLGMAHPTKRKWLYRTTNLMLTPHVIEDDLPPVEAEDEEAILSLKHEIEKWSRDNGNA